MTHDHAYPATRWSVVVRLQTGDPVRREKALDELLNTYYPVLHKFLVAGMGFAPDLAADHLHSFIADKVLAKNLLAQAAPEKGRFRNFLLKAIKNFVIGEVRKQQARKRAPAEGALAGEEELERLPAAGASGEDLYNLEWARHTLAEALGRMRRECEQKGRMNLWEIFEGRVVQPMLGVENALPYEALVQKYRFESPMQASNALITAKRMFRRSLEEVVRDTVESEAQVAEEIRELKRVLSK